ncbi:MAG: tetratricopeptide repeat protein, partial [Burkholderiales bacterium]
TILERLPYRAGDPVQRELRRLNEALRASPNDVLLASDVARRYIEHGRATSDPRYFGYARAALGVWWNDADAPTEILVLRATLHQNQHRFDLALADLDRTLSRKPKHGQARLTKAVVLQVRGQLDDAERECRALAGIAETIVTATCMAGVRSLNGDLKPSYLRLSSVLEQLPNQTPALQGWVRSYLADMAARLGDTEAAERHFLAALEAEPDDAFLLGAYADLLLDQRRAKDAVTLLRGRERADGLLLRLALAQRAIFDPAWTQSRDTLGARFAAAQLRNDRVHLREEARFKLYLMNRPAEALELALENWSIQKEPADARLVLAAARAANRPHLAKDVSAWLSTGRLEDVNLKNM